MTPEKFHTLMRDAANRARRSKPVWLDTQDLTQAAQLAVLEAKAKGHEIPLGLSPEHLENRTRQRLWGAMMDSIRTAWDGSRGSKLPPHESLSEDSALAAPAPDNPMRTAQLKEAVERFGRKGTHKQQEVILLTAAGYYEKEIAAIMGISESRVSQLKSQARKVMSMWGDL